jgi:hypothetical protein
MDGRVEILELRRFHDERGNLTPVEQFGADVPFEIRRVFWIYNIPKGARRGGHGHEKCQQVLVALHGSCTVEINEKDRYFLDDPCAGLYVDSGNYLTIDQFADDCVLLVLASERYEKEDYFDDSIFASRPVYGLVEG